MMNVHYYGVEINDLGKKLNFQVQVWEKTVNGHVYTYVDFHAYAPSYRRPSSDSDFDFKLNVDKPAEGGDVKIAGTEAFIRFIPRKKKEVTVAIETKAVLNWANKK